MNWNEAIQKISDERKGEAGQTLAAPTGSAPVLRGEWRHSHGMIFCGTLRIAKSDFDTNPHPDFCARVFDDICRTMNEAQNIAAERAARERAEARLADDCMKILITDERHDELLKAESALAALKAELERLCVENQEHNNKRFLLGFEIGSLNSERDALKLKLEAAKAALNVSAGGLTAAIEDFALLHNAGVNPARESTWLVLQDSRKYALSQLNT